MNKYVGIWWGLLIVLVSVAIVWPVVRNHRKHDRQGEFTALVYSVECINTPEEMMEILNKFHFSKEVLPLRSEFEGRMRCGAQVAVIELPTIALRPLIARVGFEVTVLEALLAIGEHPEICGHEVLIAHRFQGTNKLMVCSPTENSHLFELMDTSILDRKSDTSRPILIKIDPSVFPQK